MRWVEVVELETREAGVPVAELDVGQAAWAAAKLPDQAAIASARAAGIASSTR